MRIFKISVIVFTVIVIKKITFNNWFFQLEIMNYLLNFIFIISFIVIFYELISNSIKNKYVLNIGTVILFITLIILSFSERKQVTDTIIISPTQEIQIIQLPNSTCLGNCKDSIFIQKYFLVQKESIYSHKI